MIKSFSFVEKKILNSVATSDFKRWLLGMAGRKNRSFSLIILVSSKFLMTSELFLSTDLERILTIVVPNKSFDNVERRTLA